MSIAYRTPYYPERQDFSDMGHNEALKYIYPAFFGAGTEVERATPMQDMTEHIDYLATVRPKSFNGEGTLTPFTVQERWRRATYHKRDDVTVSVWCGNSSTPGELFRARCDYFLYGWCDGDGIIEAYIIPFSALRLAILLDTIPYGVNGQFDQNKTFAYIRIADLKEQGLISYSYRR